MACACPVSFSMAYCVKFEFSDTMYKNRAGRQTLGKNSYAKKDDRREATEYDEHAVGIYVGWELFLKF